jgi:hypothetical protein
MTWTKPTEACANGAFAWSDDEVPASPPIGFVLETGYPEPVFTLVALRSRQPVF